jgi:preprotein translocase subunit SecG
MTILLIILHLAVSIALIAVVLLQSGKGAEMGATFGTGGSQSVFGAGGGTTFMSKLTTGCAVIFMLTSLTLAYISGHGESSSVMAKKAKQAAPQKGAPAPTAPAGAPKPAAQAAPATPVAPAAQPAKPAQPAPAAPGK